MTYLVGVIGGGQLARMMVPAAVNLGIELRVLAETVDSPASIAATAVGDYLDVDTVLAFARGVDVVTFDHEHVPQPVLAALVEAGVRVRPGPHALQFAQDKILMRERLAELYLPIPDWARVDSRDDLAAFLADHGGRAVLKTSRGGYDGKGVRVVTDATDADDWLAGDIPLLVEEVVEFRRELAQLVARRPSGEIAAWPVVESVQRGGVCAEVIAPAPSSAGKLADVASDIAHTIAERLDVTGVLAVELFETTDERLLINELAMRPHNTGHWSIDGSTTSQFEQHLRAVLDLPLGATGCRDAWSVMVNVLGGPALGGLEERMPAALADQPTVKFHNYGKEPRPGRKIGHVTAGGAELDDVVWQARSAAAILGSEAALWARAAGSTQTHRCPRRPTVRGTVTMTLMPEPLVAVVMGSDSDWNVMRAASEVLAEFGVPHEVEVVSAHRTPHKMIAFGADAAGRGIRSIIAGAGGAAHLPGMLASVTTLPVIGVPVPLATLDGLDSLLSIVQMPSGVPVATVSIGGARNAGLLAIRILASTDAALAARLTEHASALEALVETKNRALKSTL
ncbi:MAG: 5-(carboxyamino)imidazole ribonucleotide synthase [Burkholderiaceae bacterium]|nr:5-(carboxyamino)imidazole ribonucleotide synthase [Microbacteriaceae bacterium]